jgi:hypothetical protein
MKLTKAILQDYIDRGLVEEARHQSLPLSVYNYTRDCQFQGNWDDVTLMCRGLIMDNNEKIVGRGFNKFFNYEELTQPAPWKSSDYVYVQEKMDGSLGMLFYYADEWHLATKGSFHSEQAVRGMEIIREKYFLPAFQKEYTYLVEIIYPENRIVVQYPKPQITFLSVFLNRSFACWQDGGDDELHWVTAQAIFKVSGIPKGDLVATEQVFDELDHGFYKKLKERNLENKEGYILRFFPSNFRCKIKFEEYVRLHRLLTNFSNVDIWECLRAQTDMTAYLKDVPDEFDSWVRQWIKSLQFAYVMKEKTTRDWLDQVPRSPLRRDEAAWILANVPKEFQGLVFSMMDGKDYSNSIWRMIRPDYQKPFWSNGDHLDEN